MYRVDFASAEFKRVLEQRWYYTIELKPGLFTRGYEFANIVCTRELIRRVTPTDKDICDIGTMEGMIPILLKRRGARSAVAIDAADSSERIQLVQQCYGEHFEYYPRTSLARAKDFLTDRAKLSHYVGQKKIQQGFDVVVLSGVLYHVFSPLHVIGLARTLLRPGGLLILETAASCHDRYAMNWVFRGDRYIYPTGTNSWFMTLKFLDHILRYMKLKPIDCVHGPLNDDATRVAIAAVAIPEPLPLKSETEWFMPENMIDYNEVVDVQWAECHAGEIAYTPGQNYFHSELTGAVDLYKTVMKTKALRDDRDRIVFHLDDRD
jgi:2-polyprenyl-3-methyl-5-hydroxy-6-metoxy-1,4-benzoquinol methylase